MTETRKNIDLDHFKKIFNNPSGLWGLLVIDQLIKNGHRHFLISPGFRCAPLISALTHFNDFFSEKIFLTSLIDERAAGFYALGLSKSLKRQNSPAPVLISTSGSALSHYLPSLIEGQKTKTPIIILSSDRPEILVGTNANQTINQNEIFKHYCENFIQLPTPHAQIDSEAWMVKLNFKLQLAMENLEHFHINIPFPLPLTPSLETAPLTIDFYQSVLFNDGFKILKSTQAVIEKKSIIEPEKSALIKNIFLVGMCDFEFSLQTEDTKLWYQAIMTKASRYDAFVIFDITSHLKCFQPEPFNWSLLPQNGKIIYRLFHFGGPPVLETPFKNWFTKIHQQGQVELVMVSKDLTFFLKAHQRLTLSPQEFFRDEFKGHFKKKLQPSPVGKKFNQYLLELPLSYLHCARTLLNQLTSEDLLFIGNSTPIRAFDEVIFFNDEQKKGFCQISFNRGASGIEGHIACALGEGKVSAKRIYIVLGDISFLHDLNSLHLLCNFEIPTTIIVMNNYGGGLFQQLPLNQFPRILNPFIFTPHQLNFKRAAEQFNLHYQMIDDKKKWLEFLGTLENGSNQKEAFHQLIEVVLDGNLDAEIFKNYNQLEYN
jgi:2-succinyl-5-enolpyruvyl-6-hydroxy-3-cyclohexene-1-carboxylate synthase